MLRYCLGSLRRPADAEDALQQTFLQAHSALGRGAQPVSEVAWLLAIARNVCLTRADALRKRSRSETPEDPSVLAEIAPGVVAEDHVSADVQAAFAVLSDRQRRVLFLREWHGFSYAEIAVALDTTEAAVETLIFRARRALADELAVSRRRRLPSLAGAVGWLRAGFGSTAAKVAVGAAAAASVSAGAAVTFGAHHSSLRSVRPAGATAAAIETVTPTRVVVRAASERPLVTRHARRRRGSVVGIPPAAPAAARSAPAALAPPTTTAAAPVFRSAPASTAVTTPAATPAPISAPAASVRAPVAPLTTTVSAVVDNPAAAVSSTVDSAAQTVGNVVPPTAPVANAAAQTVDNAAQTVSGVAAPVVGAAQSATTTVASAVPNVLGGH